MIRRCLVAAFAAAFALAALAQEHAHSHGVGRLDLAIDANGFSLALEMPLDTLVGFERAPRDPREEQAAREAAARLRSADALFAADPGARCRATKVELASPALPAALLGAAADASRANGSGHADIEAVYTFGCGKAQDLRGIDAAGLFGAFARLRNVEVRVAGPKGQAKRRLTRSRPRLSW